MEENFEELDRKIKEVVSKAKASEDYEKRMNLVLNRMDECETLITSIVSQVNQVMDLTNDEKIEGLLFEISCKLQTMKEVNGVIAKDVINV